MWLETLWTGGSCLLWPASRCKEEILIYEEHAFPAQRGMGLIKIPSVVTFGVGSLTWITYKLIWLFSSGTFIPESVNTAAVKCHLLHWAFITSLLLYFECFCNLHHLKFPFIKIAHISLNWTLSLVSDLSPLVTEVKIFLDFATLSGNSHSKAEFMVLVYWMMELFWGCCNSPCIFILCLSKFLLCHWKWEMA